jgi:hypothetical protein
MFHAVAWCTTTEQELRLSQEEETFDTPPRCCVLVITHLVVHLGSRRSWRTEPLGGVIRVGYPMT